MRFKKIKEHEAAELSEIEGIMKNKDNTYTLELIGVDFDQSDRRMNSLITSPPLAGVSDFNEWTKSVFDKDGTVTAENVENRFNCYNNYWNIVEYSENEDLT